LIGSLTLGRASLRGRLLIYRQEAEPNEGKEEDTEDANPDLGVVSLEKDDREHRKNKNNEREDAECRLSCFIDDFRGVLNKSTPDTTVD
jgi:hypothetical protein